MFVALAYWTAAWTRRAETAQLRSLPIILLTSAGPLMVSIPEMSDALRWILELDHALATAQAAASTSAQTSSAQPHDSVTPLPPWP